MACAAAEADGAVLPYPRVDLSALKGVETSVLKTLAAVGVFSLPILMLLDHWCCCWK